MRKVIDFRKRRLLSLKTEAERSAYRIFLLMKDLRNANDSLDSWQVGVED
jgi:hypothetical protein